MTDSKVADVVRVLQGISFTRTDIDSVGKAFEQFFGSIFRGGLGQYFTMRQLARFVIAMLDVTQDDYVLDPTAGSGGFLLEALLQVWHGVDHAFQGQPPAAIQRLKIDFALNHVYGIEIHEILGRMRQGVRGQPPNCSIWTTSGPPTGATTGFGGCPRSPEAGLDSRGGRLDVFGGCPRSRGRPA